MSYVRDPIASRKCDKRYHKRSGTTSRLYRQRAISGYVATARGCGRPTIYVSEAEAAAVFQQNPYGVRK